MFCQTIYRCLLSEFLINALLCVTVSSVSRHQGLQLLVFTWYKCFLLVSHLYQFFLLVSVGINVYCCQYVTFYKCFFLLSVCHPYQCSLSISLGISVFRISVSLRVMCFLSVSLGITDPFHRHLSSRCHQGWVSHDQITDDPGGWHRVTSVPRGDGTCSLSCTRGRIAVMTSPGQLRPPRPSLCGRHIPGWRNGARGGRQETAVSQC